MIKSVAIIGDSWSKCSWQPDVQYDKPSQLTFEDLFAVENISVINLSKAGLSNQDYITLIKNNFDQLKTVDKILIFQTDPLRDIWSAQTPTIDHENVLENLYKMNCRPTKNLNELIEFLLKRFYNQLLEFTELQAKFLLIGGLSCLNYQLISEKIKSLPKSLMEYLVDDFIDCHFRFNENVFELNDLLKITWQWDQTEAIKNVFEIEKKVLSKNYVWQTSELFTCSHLSDAGFKKVSDLLIGHLKGVIK